jgi:hypothetical protein
MMCPCDHVLNNLIFPCYSGVAFTSMDSPTRLRLQDNGLKLRIEQLEMSDAANYSCHAHNLYGRDDITYHLEVKCKICPSNFTAKLTQSCTIYSLQSHFIRTASHSDVRLPIASFVFLPTLKAASCHAPIFSGGIF